MSPGIIQLATHVPVPVPSPLAIQYYRTGNILWIVKTLWPIVMLSIILFTGCSAWLRDRATRVSNRWYGTLVIYFVLLTVLMVAVNVPLDYYSGFVRPHQYGLSSQVFGKWARDECIGLGLTLVTGCLTLWVPYLLFRYAPKRWWLYTWIASIPLILLVMFVSPIWIDPLFNHFQPLHDKALATQIFALAHRAGIEGVHIYVVNKSVDTNTLNAYVIGIGSVKRIVLWDTAIRHFSPQEVLFVIGHEMGHYVLDHVWKTIVLMICLLLVSLWLTHQIVPWILSRWSARLGFSRLADVASLPLLLLLFNLLTVVGKPLVSPYFRHNEHVADRFGLDLTHDNYACAMTFVTLGQHSLTVPYPGVLWTLWRSTHPSAGDRITFCNDYHPWLAKQ